MYSRNKERLEYFSTIEKGWLDDADAGEPISENIIQRSKEVLELIQQNDIEEPMIFPMEEGFILIEWHLNHGIITIDVEPDTYYLFALDTTKESEDRYTNIADVTDIEEVIKFALEKVKSA